MSSPSSTATASTNRQHWLIYPRKYFLPVRIIQVLTSFAFILVTATPIVPEVIGYVLYLPVYIIAFILYTSTLVAYLHNPTRLSRVVVDPKKNAYPRKALLPVPNKDNLSRKGATLTIVILEFVIVLYISGVFITGIILASFIGYEICYSGDSGNSENTALIKKCTAWIWSNNIIGCLGLLILGMMTFVWGVRVYRAGWRESCKREMERELLAEMEMGRGGRKSGLRGSGTEEGMGETEVELGEMNRE